MSIFTVATLFPLMTVAAGDEAGASALVRRAARRGLEGRAVTVDSAGDLPEAEILLIGGAGGVGPLVTALRGTDFVERVQSGRTLVFAVDAGMDALGREWVDGFGVAHPGLGLLGIWSGPAHGPARTVATRPTGSGLPAMVGWLAHEIPTVRDPELAALTVVEPVSSGQPPQPDGAVTAHVIATRLHGPVLALNPELADLVLAKALGALDWPALPDPVVERARAARLAEVTGAVGARAVGARAERAGSGWRRLLRR